MTAVARKLKIDITSDTVCPFCILGITQLQQAIAKYTKIHGPIETTYRLWPYQLRPEMPDKPFKRNDYSRERFGPGRYEAMFKQLQQQFKSVGLELHPDAMLANTNDCHRLETLAFDKKGNDDQFDLGMDLMRAYQLDGIAPTDRKMLSGVALKYGLFSTEEEAIKWLDSTELNTKTQEEYAKARREGITGVPHFIFQDKYVTSGAIGVDAFYEAIDKILSNKV